jgi:hypothetical protein
VIAVAGVLVAGLAVMAVPADRWSAQPSARQTLLSAATRLNAGSTRTGRYWTVDLSTRTTVSSFGDAAAGPPPPAAAPRYRYTSTCDARLWGARSGTDPSWLVIRSVTDRRLTAADERAWRRAGSPAASGCQIHHVSIGMRRSAPPAALRLPRSVPANPPDGPAYPTVLNVPVTLDQITALPTGPEALKAVLDDLYASSVRAWQGTPGAPRVPAPGQSAPPDVTVQEIADLLISTPVPPVTQVALYRVLADLPIDRSRGTVTDPLGRRGVAFWAPRGAFPGPKLIVDPRTGHLLAVEEHTSGELDAYTLVRRQGWTDSVPDLPARRL